MFEYLKFSNIQGQKVRTVLASLILRLAHEERLSGELSFQFPQTLLNEAEQRQLMNTIVEVEWLHQRNQNSLQGRYPSGDPPGGVLWHPQHRHEGVLLRPRH